LLSLSRLLEFLPPPRGRAFCPPAAEKSNPELLTSRTPNGSAEVQLSWPTSQPRRQ